MYVYLIAESETGFCKIGVSQDPVFRLRELQTATPHELQLVYIIECTGDSDARRLEAILHARYRAYWASGEWFRVPADNIVADLDWCLRTAPLIVKATNRSERYSRSKATMPTAPDPECLDLDDPVQYALEQLREHPEYLEMSIRRLSRVIRVRKTSVHKALHILRAEQQEAASNGGNDHV